MNRTRGTNAERKNKSMEPELIYLNITVSQFVSSYKQKGLNTGECYIKTFNHLGEKNQDTLATGTHYTKRYRIM